MELEQLQELANLHEELFGGSKGYGFTETSDSNKTDPYPKGHIAFDYQGAIITPAVAAIATILSFTVPLGYDGLINMMTNVYLGGDSFPVLKI